MVFRDVIDLNEGISRKDMGSYYKKRNWREKNNKYVLKTSFVPSCNIL